MTQTTVAGSRGVAFGSTSLRAHCRVGTMLAGSYTDWTPLKDRGVLLPQDVDTHTSHPAAVQERAGRLSGNKH